MAGFSPIPSSAPTDANMSRGGNCDQMCNPDAIMTHFRAALFLCLSPVRANRPRRPTPRHFKIAQQFREWAEGGCSPAGIPYLVVSLRRLVVRFPQCFGSIHYAV